MNPAAPSPRHILLEAAQDIQNQPHLFKMTNLSVHGLPGTPEYIALAECQCTCAGLALFRAAERLAAPGATPEAVSDAANSAVSALVRTLGLTSPEPDPRKVKGSDLAHAVFAWNDRPETTQEGAVSALRTAAAVAPSS